MNKMNFQEMIKEKLTHYKKDVLNVYEKGVNGKKGYKKTYAHILPINLKELNIIEHYRDDFFNSKYAGIDYHNCFHHLNSSQALCINLFYPLIHENKLDLILKQLDMSTSDIVNPEFEFESDIEQTNGRKTNVDFYFEIPRQIRIYIEIKYTEQKFGSAVDDQRHRNKFKKTYLPLLSDNPFIREEYKSMKPFLENYQILRNLIHISKDSVVVFLFPEANRKVYEQAKMAYEEMLTDCGRERLRLLSLEDTVEHIRGSLKNEKLRRHFEEFEGKYFRT